MPTQTEVQYKQRVNNFVDGVALNSAVYPLPYVYQWLCYDAAEAARVANNYKPKIYAIPDQAVFPIRVNPPVTNADNPGMLPFSDYVTQVRMLPGTLVVGMSLTLIFFTAPGSYSANAFRKPGNFYVTALDDATGIPFFTDWPCELNFNVPVLWQGDGLLPPIQNKQCYVAKTAWLPLTKPRAVLAPGIISVAMSYKGTPGDINISPQLILQCAEPCNVMRPGGGNPAEECI